MTISHDIETWDKSNGFLSTWAFSSDKVDSCFWIYRFLSSSYTPTTLKMLRTVIYIYFKMML